MQDLTPCVSHLDALNIKTSVCGLEVSHRRFSGHAGLIRAIEAAGPTSGWAELQSGLWDSQSSNNLAWAVERYGFLTQAELSLDRHSSLHISTTGDGEWLMTLLEETAGHQYLALDEASNKKQNAGQQIIHRTYWTAERTDQPGLAPVYSRFTGFRSR
jgi:hypothetical protein